MEYRIEDCGDFTFENVKKISLGSGKSYYIYKNNEPYIVVDTNFYSCFFDGLIFQEYLVIGNNLEGIYIIDLNSLRIKNIKVNGYFGYFEVYQNVLYVLGCEDVMAFNSDMDMLWKSDNLAVDGVVCDSVEDEIMSLSCEINPPGGWVNKKISLKDGKVL